MVVVEWTNGVQVHVEDGLLVKVTPEWAGPMLRDLLDTFEVTGSTGDPDIARANWLLDHFPHGYILSATEDEDDFDGGPEQPR